MAKEKREEKLGQQAGAALNLIDNLSHVGKIEFMNGVAEMCSAIGSFLEADLILGGDEGKECTYSKGYMKRQALFSCLTCTPKGDAGVCTACSLACHDGHEIPIDEEGELSYEDFICQNCSTICAFISLYPQSIRAPTKENSCEKMVSGNGPPASASMVLPESISCNSEVVSQQVGSALLEEKTEKDMGSKQGGTSVSDATLTGNCILGGLGSCLVACSSDKRKPVFLSKGWREQLCRCGTCVDFYSQKGISYLIDKEDSDEEYEKMAKEKREEKLGRQAGAALNLIDNLGHVGKIEFMNGVAEMCSAIGSFLCS